MADNKTKSKFPPDAVPRRYRDNLVPASAVGVPEPIRDASEQLRVCGAASPRSCTGSGSRRPSSCRRWATPTRRSRSRSTLTR